MEQKPRTPTPRTIYRKTFEVETTKDVDNHLGYFIKQELGYYNALVEQLGPRLRAFPQELLAIKDREKKLWEACAEHAVPAQKLLDHPVNEWPEKLRLLESLVYDQAGEPKITSAQANILSIAAAPARLHPQVRKNISSEILRYMIGQSDSVIASQKTEGFRSPIQLLTTHTLESKRHLQIPGSLVKMSYDAGSNSTHISIPYTKEPLVVHGIDITEARFNVLIVRASDSNAAGRKWFVDLKDSTSRYMLNLTDSVERRKK
jgi:hypothetical protein